MKAYTTKLNNKPHRVRVEMTTTELMGKLRERADYRDGISWVEEAWVVLIEIGEDNKGLTIVATAPPMKKCDACEDGWNPVAGEDGKKQLCAVCGGDCEMIACP